MRFRFVLMVMLLTLSGCAFGAPDQSGAPVSQAATPSIAETPAGTRGPRGNFTPQPNFTPGAGRTPSGQRTQQTPAANTTPATNDRNATPAPTSAAPTAVVVSAITTTNSIPTAVPIPQIIIPTSIPSAGNSPSSTSSGNPTNSTGQPTDKGGNPLPPANTPVVATNTSGNAPTPIPLPNTTTNTTNLAALRGKIVFLSDRGGLYPQLYVMNPDGSDQHLCNCSDVLTTMVNNELTSPDKKQFLFVKQAGSARSQDFQIWTHNNELNEDKVITGAPPGFPTVDYDPAWSPDARFIAWVSEANGFDEIYLHNRDTNEDDRLTESHGEWYKHPSFSPDGSQLVFWSNRSDVNRKQIWLMSLDGSNQRNIGNNQYNDWQPIWVK